MDIGKKKVLDPCCGSRMFYFQPKASEVLFCDFREITEELCDGRNLHISPDLIADVTELPFPDESFHLVVFDPPHLTVGSGWQVEKYGKLPKDWKAWMTKAFSECWRVLKPNGTLVFKWFEYRIKASEIIKCAPCKPLFGNRRMDGHRTHWMVFFKSEERDAR